MRHAFGTGVINYAQRYADHEIPYLRQHNDRVWSAQSDPFLLFVSDGYHAASCRVRAYESRASRKPLFKQDLPTYSKKDPGRMTENVQTRRTQSRKAVIVRCCHKQIYAHIFKADHTPTSFPYIQPIQRAFKNHYIKENRNEAFRKEKQIGEKTR